MSDMNEIVDMFKPMAVVLGGYHIRFTAPSSKHSIRQSPSSSFISTSIATLSMSDERLGGCAKMNADIIYPLAGRVGATLPA